MFDIGFGELALVFVIGLVVLGPERLPVAVRTVVGWIRALRSLASTVQNELAQELKLQELQDSLKKVEEASKSNLTPELKASMDELREAADSMKRTFNSKLVLDEEDTPHTIHNPVVSDPQAHDGVTPAEGASQAEAPAMAPGPQTDTSIPDDIASRAETADMAMVQTGTVTPAGPARQAEVPAAAPRTDGENQQPAATAPEQHAAPPTPKLHNDR